MKNRKTFWFLVVTALLFIWIGWFIIYRTLNTGADFYWSIPIVTFSLSLILLSIYILAERNKQNIYLVMMLATLPAVFWGGRYWYVMLPAWIFCNILIITGVDRIWNERDNRIRIIPHSLMRFGLPLITTAFCLLIATDYYLAVKDKSEAGTVPAFQLQVPKEMVYASLDVASSLVPEPELRAIAEGETVDEFLKGSLKQGFRIEAEDVEQYMVQQRGRPLTEEERRQVQEQVEGFSSSTDSLALFQARQRLSAQVNTPLQGNEKMNEVIANYVNQRISNFINGDRQDGNRNILPLGMALALFITVKSIAWLLGYPLAWTTTGIFRIMVRMKALSVVKNQKEVEEIA